MFAKLENGNLVVAPKRITENGKMIINPGEEKLREFGYYPVIRTEAPEEIPGSVAVPSWELVGDEIRQVWNTEPSNIVPDELTELRSIVDYNLMMGNLDDPTEEDEK